MIGLWGVALILIRIDLPRLGYALFAVSAVIAVAEEVLSVFSPHQWLADGPLRTERLEIEPLDESNLETYIGMLDARFLEENHWSTENRDSHAARLRSRRWGQRFRALIALVKLRENPSGPPIGVVSVGYDYQGENPTFTLGVTLEPAMRRLGYGTELVSAVTATLRAQGYRPLHVIFDVDDEAALRTCRKLGLDPASSIMDFEDADGTRREVRVFRLIA